MTAGGRQATSSSERMHALDSPRLLAWGAASSLWVIAAVVRKATLLFLVLPGLLELGAAPVRLWPFGGNQHMVFAAPPPASCWWPRRWRRSVTECSFRIPLSHGC